MSESSFPFQGTRSPMAPSRSRRAPDGSSRPTAAGPRRPRGRWCWPSRPTSCCSPAATTRPTPSCRRRGRPSCRCRRPTPPAALAERSEAAEDLAAKSFGRDPFKALIVGDADGRHRSRGHDRDGRSPATTVAPVTRRAAGPPAADRPPVAPGDQRADRTSTVAHVQGRRGRAGQHDDRRQGGRQVLQGPRGPVRSSRSCSRSALIGGRSTPSSSATSPSTSSAQEPLAIA